MAVQFCAALQLCAGRQCSLVVLCSVALHSFQCMVAFWGALQRCGSLRCQKCDVLYVFCSALQRCDVTCSLALLLLKFAFSVAALLPALPFELLLLAL